MTRGWTASILGLLLVALCLSLAPPPASAREEKAKAACLDSATPPEERITACTRYLRGAKPPPEEQVPILRARARAHRDLERYDEALADIDAALAIRPDDAALYQDRGLILDWKGDNEAALAEYDRAAALDPEDSWTHYARGMVLKELRRLEESIAAFDQALLISPNYAGAFEGRAAAHQLDKNYHAAYDDYGRAVTLRPYRVTNYVRRGRMAELIARPVEAVRLYRIALLLDPNSGAADYALDEMGVDQSRALPLAARPVTPGPPRTGLVLHYLQQVIDPAAEVEIDPMEEAIGELAAWFSGPKARPMPLRSLFVTRRVGPVAGKLANITIAASYQGTDSGAEIRESQADYLWGLWPASFPTPQGPGAEIRYGPALAEVWSLAPGQSASGEGEVVVNCPPEGVQPDLLAAIVGCQPGQSIQVGQLSWTATAVGWENILLPIGRHATLRLHYVEQAELTLMGQTKSRSVDLTWWWSPEFDWWLRRRQEKDGEIEVTEVVGVSRPD